MVLADNQGNKKTIIVMKVLYLCYYLFLHGFRNICHLWIIKFIHWTESMEFSVLFQFLAVFSPTASELCTLPWQLYYGDLHVETGNIPWHIPQCTQCVGRFEMPLVPLETLFLKSVAVHKYLCREALRVFFTGYSYQTMLPELSRAHFSSIVECHKEDHPWNCQNMVLIQWSHFRGSFFVLSNLLGQTLMVLFLRQIFQARFQWFSLYSNEKGAEKACAWRQVSSFHKEVY